MGHHPGEALLEACAAQAIVYIRTATPQEVANTLWSYAKLQHSPGDAFLAACAALALARIRKAQDVAITLWSYVKLQYDPGDALLAAYAARAAKRVFEASPQNLANTVWSFATLQHHPGAALLQRLEVAAVRSAAAFNLQEVVRDALPALYALKGSAPAEFLGSLAVIACSSASLQLPEADAIHFCELARPRL